MLCQCIKASWQKISPKMIIRVFRKCCISDKMVGRENDILWDHEEEVGNVGNEHESVSSECENKEGNCKNSEPKR
jgi:hypothetical protein